MEEDIMILETECYYLEELGYLRENNHFIRFNQALKNLIKGYKLEKLKNVLDEQSLKEALEDYIPKSLIKEKIEEYKAKTDCRYCNNSCDSYAVCKVLEELLKGE